MQDEVGERERFCERCEVEYVLTKEETYVCPVCATCRDNAQSIDCGKDWRDFDVDEHNTEGNSRQHVEINDEFNSLNTNISSHSFGTKSKSNLSTTAMRHLKEANGPQGRRQMKLLAAFKRLRFLGDLNNMTMPVINAGKEILERFEELSTGNYTFRGYKSDAFSLAVILLACKNMQTGHTLKELARTSAVDIKEIKKFYKVLVKNPRLTEVCVPTGDPSTFPQSTRISTQASDLVESIINRMTLVPRPPYRTISRAREVAQEAVELLVGKQPPTVAAAAVQFVLQVENRAFQVNDLCKVAEISTNTLRAAWKVIIENVDSMNLPQLFSPGNEIF